MGSKIKVNWQESEVEGERLSFQTQAEEWNIYSAEDGSILKMKTVVSDIVRLSVRKPDGEPVYLVKSTNIVETQVPPHLLHKPKKGEIN